MYVLFNYLLHTGEKNNNICLNLLPSNLDNESINSWEVVKNFFKKGSRLCIWGFQQLLNDTIHHLRKADVCQSNKPGFWQDCGLKREQQQLMSIYYRLQIRKPARATRSGQSSLVANFKTAFLPLPSAVWLTGNKELGKTHLVIYCSNLDRKSECFQKAERMLSVEV